MDNQTKTLHEALIKIIHEYPERILVDIVTREFAHNYTSSREEKPKSSYRWNDGKICIIIIETKEDNQIEMALKAIEGARAVLKQNDAELIHDTKSPNDFKALAASIQCEKLRIPYPTIKVDDIPF